MPSRFPGSEKARLKDERRRAVQPAEELIDHMSPGPDEVCVDIGSGIGYIAIPLSRKVSKVIAVDIQRQMLEAMVEAVGRRDNIEPLMADASHLPLADASVDRVILINVLHELEDPEGAIGSIARVLKAGGRVSLVDFPRRPTSIGPPVGERIDIDDAIAMFRHFHPLGRWELSEYYQVEMERH